MNRFSTLAFALLGLIACSGPASTTNGTSTGGTTSTGGSGGGAGSGGTSADGGAAGAGGSVVCDAPAISETMEVQNELGSLEGTVEVPAGCAPFPMVLILGGFLRDGLEPDGTGPGMYRMIAHELSARGIASARYDKRGNGGSADAGATNGADYRFSMMADDAARWVAALHKDGRFGKVFVAGHSEGATEAMLAADQQAFDGFISLAGPGRSAGDVLRDQLKPKLSSDLMAQANVIIDALIAGNTVSSVPPELDYYFNADTQPYLASWFPIVGTKEIVGMTMPTLLVHGYTDIQVSINETLLLADAKPDAELVLLDGMNHVLKQATLDSASQKAAYTDPSVPLGVGLIDAIAGFVDAHSK